MVNNTVTLTAMSMREKLKASLFAVGIVGGALGGYVVNDVIINPDQAANEQQDDWTDEAWALYTGFVIGFMGSSTLYLAWQHRDLQNGQVAISQVPTPIEPELER